MARPSRGATACPAGQSCSLRITWAGGPDAGGEEFFTCVLAGNECDPLTQNCTVATQGCYPTQSGNKCFAPGTGNPGDACAFVNSCRRATTCVDINNTGFKCYSLCTPAGIDAGTDGGLTCAAGTCNAIGDGSYGVCI